MSGLWVGVIVAGYFGGGGVAIAIMIRALGLRFADGGDFHFKWFIWPVTLLIGLGLHLRKRGLKSGAAQ